MDYITEDYELYRWR